MSSYTKPKKFDANLIVIGAGSAGLVSAYIAAAVKAKVILIEKHKMGGDCLNYGCVPSKALIRSAKYIHQIKHSQNYGIKSASVDFDFSDVMRRVQKVIEKIEPHDSIERYEGLGVEVKQGEGRLVSPYEVEVNGTIFSARSIIIAAGAQPFVPPIQGIENVNILTSDNLWSIRDLPKKLVVLGGGPIGCELAQCFTRFGSEVTIVEMLPKIMIREDEDVSTFISNKFEQEGVRLLTDHKAVRFDKNGIQPILICELKGKQIEIEFDRVLVAVGRSARLEGYGLQELGVPHGRTIEVNDYLQAGYPSLYACGDVAGPFQFTHTAAHQAWYAAVNALFGRFKKFKVDYSIIPWATFTDPEVARVGLNQQDADKAGIEYELSHYPLSDLDRSITEEEDRGFIKVLTVPGKDKILGVTIVGAHAGDLIAEFVFAMKQGLGLEKILGTIHIYPTRMEANKFLAGNWKKAHSPQWALSLLEKYHRWQRG